jgi:hypothetical protein
MCVRGQSPIKQEAIVDTPTRTDSGGFGHQGASQSREKNSNLRLTQTDCRSLTFRYNRKNGLRDR